MTGEVLWPLLDRAVQFPNIMTYHEDHGEDPWGDQDD